MIELVYWRDANHSLDGFGDEEGHDFIMQTVGWTREKGIWLVVIGEKQPDGNERGVTRIPIVNIVSRVPLKQRKQQ